MRGTYAPSDQAREITKSRSFTRPSRVLARFSLEADANLRGFTFRLGSNGQHSEIFTQSAPVHFARTLDQMLAILEARVREPNGQTTYIAAHPLPASFARTTYWGVHAFPAISAIGVMRFIKFKVMPVGEEGQQATNEASTSAVQIHRDLESRIAARDIRFSVMALLDRPGDPVMDVTIRWPDEDAREAMRLGTIVITGMEADEACDEATFNPGNLDDGIGHPPDEMFAARCAAYTLAQTKRR